MSVLIKGMNMPTRCEDCPVCHYMERGTITACGCKATMMIRPIDCNSKPYWCPLVEVCAPHGRLIDADAFTKNECNSCDGACESLPCDCLNCEADCRCDFMKDIADAPTIILAEDGENGT